MRPLILAAAIATTLLAPSAFAATYKIDTTGQHASINFKIKHLGYSWLTGRFDKFNGQFEWDKDAPEKSAVQVSIDTTSINSNHAERDKHLKSAEFLDVSQYPTATFKSTSYKPDESGGMLTGELTLHGVTKTISFPIKQIGEGKDPWGGYRAGFEGMTVLKLKDYGINYNLGPASEDVILELYLEGVRQ